MSHGVAGNGRAGDWYVEVEEEIATESHTLLIEHPSHPDDQIKIPLKNAQKDLADLIAALQQTQRDLSHVE